MAFSDPRGAASRRRWALAALLLVTLIWGLSFPWTKTALTAVRLEAEAEGLPGPWAERAGLLLFTGLRFGIALLLLGLLNRLRGATRRSRAAGEPAWRCGVILGGLLALGMLLNSEGLRDLEPAVSAFLTSLYVLFTLLFAALARRRWPRPSLQLGVLLASLGAAFIDGPPQAHFGLPAALTLASAALFAAQILAIDRFGPRVEALVLTESLFASAAAICAAGLAGLWLAGCLPPATFLAVLVARPDFWQPLALMVALATLFALTAMQLFQRWLDPVRAAVLYALEPVWAALYQALQDPAGIDRWLVLGGAAVLCGNLIAEWLPRLGSRR
jgi:drug/metabolite transporter (DMT)-like permease